jgi:AcrR family transcriptional regulator
VTAPSERRAHLVLLAGELFAEKGFRATTVREIADAAGILSGSLYHHFDSKESIGDEILQGFLNEVLADYREAAATEDDPRAVLERVVRTSTVTLSRHRPRSPCSRTIGAIFPGSLVSGTCERRFRK